MFSIIFKSVQKLQFIAILKRLLMLKKINKITCHNILQY